MQIFFDVKDTEGDRRKKLKTLSAEIGDKKTLKILKIATVLVSLFGSIIFALIFSNLFLIFILTIPFNFYCFKLAEKKNYFAYILGSFEFLLWLILVFFASILI